MSIIEKQLSYLFVSDPINGARNVSSNGDAFSVQLDSPIHIPHNAIHCHLKLTQAEIWNVVPNISAAIGNNTLYIYTDWAADPDPPNPVNFQIVIPDGLYSLTGLNNFISSSLINLNYPSTMIVLSGDDATQKSILTFNQDNTQIDFTQNNTPRDVLGFNARLAPLALEPAVHVEFGDAPAAFNRTNSFVIQGDLISNGIPINNIARGVLANVPITNSPGKQVIYQPYLPPAIAADELIGKSKNYFSFRLTDQLNRPVDTLGEHWSFTVTISYWLKV
jgi:hypothetical protein